jgi:RNA polymerase sigma factor for flagellar operon FliA
MATAEEELLAEYGHRVRIVARQIHKRFPSVPLQDLEHFGIEGLLDARTRFDASRGFEFWTFAQHRVRYAIQDGLKELLLIPRRVRETGRALLEEHASSTEDATPEDLELGYELFDQIAFAMRVQTADSADSPAHGVEQRQYIDTIWSAVSSLSDQESTVIEEHFRSGKKLVEIAGEMGISESWIGRVRKKALQNLREMLDNPTAMLRKRPPPPALGQSPGE